VQEPREGRNEVERPPRLLIVVNVFNPDRGGGGAIFSDLAYGLVERGFDVTVRCAYPYYPEWTDKSGKNGRGIERYDDQGAHVERYGIFIPTKPNALWQRLLYEGSFLLSLLRSLPRGRDFDAVMVYCPLVGSVAFAVANKLVWRKPLWLNVQDLSADAAAASGIATNTAVIALLRGVQSWFFNRADVWSTISPVMVARLRALRRRDQPVVYLPNWLNGSMARELERLPDKTGRAPGSPVKLLYAGNIGTKQDLLRFCQTLHTSDAPFVFRIHGDGGRAEEIRAWIETTGDARFCFGPFLEEADFAAALHETDFFVITEKTESGGSFIPCKAISGLASHSAILAVCDSGSPLGHEMREAEPGPCFGWDALDAVPAFLARVAAGGEPFPRWQENARARAAFYARGQVIDRCAAALRVVIESGGDPAALRAGLADQE
jgi:glycosyltransferase involved in cell wall biosynthesis